MISPVSPKFGATFIDMSELNKLKTVDGMGDPDYTLARYVLNSDEYHIGQNTAISNALEERLGASWRFFCDEKGHTTGGGVILNSDQADGPNGAFDNSHPAKRDPKQYKLNTIIEERIKALLKASGIHNYEQGSFRTLFDKHFRTEEDNQRFENDSTVGDTGKRQQFYA